MSQMAITSPPQERPLTIADWEALPEDEPGEFVDGRIVEDEVPDAPHEVVVVWLLLLLGGWVRERNGRVLGSESKFALSARRGRKPDLSVYFDRDRKLPRRGALKSPPDVLIEVVSPTPRDGRRDRVEKLAEYAVFGARWYWLVDPWLRTVEILELGSDAHYKIAASASEGAIAVPGCEGLTLDLDALWREVDDSIEDTSKDEPASGE